MKTILVFFALIASAYGQTAAAVMPQPNIQFFDMSTGVALPLNGGLLYTYAAGTTTPLATYVDYTKTTTNSNPVVLNSAGYNAAGSGNAGIWLGNSCYKFVLKTSAAVTIWTQDQVCNPTAGTLAQFAATTSAQLAGVITNETGTTLLVFNTDPVLVRPLATHALAGGTAPTIASGFGTAPSITGADGAFKVTVGAGGVDTTGVVTFGAAWVTAPICISQSDQVIVAAGGSAPVTGTADLMSGAVTGTAVQVAANGAPTSVTTTTTTATITQTGTTAFSAGSHIKVLCVGN